MSQANVERIAELYERYLSTPVGLSNPKLLEYFDPEVVVEQSASLLGTRGTFRGYPGLAASAREAFETFREMHYVPTELIDAGDDVLAVTELRARGRQSDVEVLEPVCHLWTLRDGRIVTWRVILDVDEARSAAGLDP